MHIQKQRLRYTLYSMALIAACIVAFLCYVFLAPFASDYLSATPFDSAQWKRAETQGGDSRIYMVDDLLAQHRLVGQSRAEIDALLGTPKKTGYFTQYDYVYYLGPERSAMSIDSQWLAIDFEGDTVREAVIVTD